MLNYIMGTFDMDMSLFDLREYYLNYNENELIRILEELVRSYFSLYLENNFVIFERLISKLQNETEFGFKLRFDYKEVSIDFAFTKDFQYGKELIVPNIYICTPKKTDISNYVPKNQSTIIYLKGERSISYLITAVIPIGTVKSMKCSTMFEIALNILFERAVNIKLN